MSLQNTYQPIARGASLLLAFSLSSKTVLVIGGGNLAATRAFAALQADARVVVWVEGGLGSVCDELAYRASQQELEVHDLDRDPDLDVFLSKAGTQEVSFAFITDTLMGTTGKKRSTQSLMRLGEILRRHRIPTNVADMPAFCDFTIPAAHRFSHSKTFEPTSLQLAVTTNGRGCRLASRIRRDIVSKLPTTVADAVETISQLRSCAKALDEEQINGAGAAFAECDGCLPSTPNKPVPQLSIVPESTAEEISKRRMRWIAQISEFWPLDKLGSLTPEEQKAIVAERPPPVDSSNAVPPLLPSRHSLDIRSQPLGRILLLGSGPGHPSLLTLAAYHTLTKQATFVLSDKLVPAPVLALIPSHVPVKIAKKFPGNADGAQNELMVEAVEAARRGEVVVRLKQGDPGIFGRVGEEILYFRAHGFEPTIVPGVSSALAGPTFSNISLTQRGVAESFIVCTGVGRQGKAVSLPGYARSRTVVLLMGVARLGGIVEALVQKDMADGKGRRDGAAYPPYLPIAIIESASMADQRIITGTLKSIQAAMDSIGEQRPPGMIVIGWTVLALWREGEITVLDEDESLNSETRDMQRVEKWLNGRSWRVQEGLSKEWAELTDALMQQ